MVLARVSAKAAERTIVNFLRTCPPDVIQKLIREDVDILELITWLCKKYPRAKKTILTTLGSIRMFAQLHPKPDVDEAYGFILARLKRELPKVYPVITNGGKDWLRKNVERFIRWIWG